MKKCIATIFVDANPQSMNFDVQINKRLAVNNLTADDVVNIQTIPNSNGIGDSQTIIYVRKTI